MWEAGSTGMANTGYEHQKTYSDVVAMDTAEERVVAITPERVFDVETTSGLSETEIPISVGGEIGDVAVGRGSYVFLVVDGELIPYSTTGTVGGPWAESVRNVVALNDSKLAIAVLDDGRVRGFRAHNGLERFTITPLDQEVAEETLEVVAGRERFVTYAGSTLRCFDDRGSEQFETTFDSPIQTAGLISDSVLVSLESGTVVWIDESGVVQLDTERDLAAVSACGERLLFGSSDGDVTVFGQSGIVQQIVDKRPDAIMQTGRDSYVTVVDGGDLHLFQRQSPSTDVQIKSKDDEPTLIVNVENPYRVPLTLHVEVDSKTSSSSILVPPRFNKTTEIQLSSLEPSETPSVWIGTEDRSIVAYDEEPTYEIDQQESGATEQTEDSPEADLGSESTDTHFQEFERPSKSQPFKDNLSGGENNPNNKSVDSTEESKGESTDQSHRDGDLGEQSAQQNLADETGEESGTGSEEVITSTSSSGEDSDQPVSVTSSLSRVVTGAYEWAVSIKNTSEDPVHDVTLEIKRPAKASFRNEFSGSITSIEAGEEISQMVSCIKPEIVEISITWTDDAGDKHETEVSNGVTVPDIEVRATVGAERETADLDRLMAGHIEFYFKNPLSVPIHDEISIDTQQASFPDLVSRRSITLAPGENLVTLGASEDVLSDGAVAGKFHVEFKWLNKEMDVDAYPESGVDEEGSPSYTRDLYSYVLEQKNGEASRTHVQKHLDEISPDLPKDILIESISIRNDTDNRLTAGALVPASEDEEALEIPSLNSGSKLTYRRFWQYVGGKKSTMTLPGYDLQGFDSVQHLGEKQVSIGTKDIVPKVALVKLGVDRDPKLLVNIAEELDGKVSVSWITLAGTSCTINVDDFQLSGQNSVRLFDLPEEFDQHTFEGISIIKFTGDTFTFKKFAVVHEIQSPPITDQEQWFKASAESTTDGDNVQITIENIVSKRNIQDVVLTAIPSKDVGRESSSSRDRVEMNELIHGQSISYVYPTTAIAADSLILDVEATYEEGRVSNRVLVRPGEEDEEDDWICSVIPTEKNIDLDALTDSTHWPEWLSTGWQPLQD